MAVVDYDGFSIDVGFDFGIRGYGSLEKLFWFFFFYR